jgi:alpha-1,2-mannosyltransferase
MALIAAIFYKLGIFSHIYHFLYSVREEPDSWYPMYAAWKWFQQPHTSTMYQEIFFTRHIKFQYPPSSLLIIAAAQALHFNLNYSRLNLIGDTLAFVQGAATSLITLSWSRWSQQTFTKKVTWVCGSILIGGLSLFCLETASGIAGGQVSVWLNCWFVLACLCWIHNRRATAGALIGLVCLVKPQLGLFLIWAALRKEKRFLAGWAAVVVPGELLSIAVFGVANNLDYFNALRFLASHGEAYYPNQSFNGLMNRLLGNGNTIVFDSHGFPPYNRTVYLVTLATTLIVLTCAMLYRWRSKPVNVIDLLIAGMSFSIASPIAWEFHFGFVPASIVIAMMTARRVASKGSRILLQVTLGLTWFFSSFMPIPQKLPLQGWGSILQSSMLFALLCLLGLLYYLRDYAGDDAVPQAQPVALPSLEAATSSALPR